MQCWNHKWFVRLAVVVPVVVSSRWALLLHVVGLSCVYVPPQRKQADIIMEPMAQLDVTLVDLSQESSVQASRQAVQQALHLLQHVGRSWQAILPLDLCAACVARLADAMMQHCIALVLKKGDIRIRESHVIHDLWEELRQALVKEEWLQGRMAQMNAFRAVTEIMVMNMSQVQAHYANGVLQCLRKEDISALVKSLFENNAKRQSLLDFIASAPDPS